MNVLKATEAARSLGAVTAVLAGKDGGRIAKIADYLLVVPCGTTVRIQESHILIIHILCELYRKRNG